MLTPVCSAQQLETWTIRADLVSVDADTGLAQAIGHALLEYRDSRLEAEQIDANLDTRQIAAAGRVVITRGESRITAEQASYNLGTQQGKFSQARYVSGQYFFRGGQINTYPSKLTIVNAMATPCDEERPHVRITGRQVTVYPGRRAEVRHASFWVGGTKLITVPRYSISLERGEEAGVPMPTPGLSKIDGLFLGWGMTLAQLGEDTPVRLEFRLGQRHLLRGNITARRQESWGEIRLASGLKEDMHERVARVVEIQTFLRRVLVDRFPELSLLYHSRQGTPRIEGLLSFGRYHERPLKSGISSATGNRAMIGLELTGPSVPTGAHISLTPGLGVRHAFYGDGQNLSLLAPWLAARARPGKDLALTVAYVHRISSGSSPFQFDQVDISREISGAADALIGRHWRVRTLTRYDLHRGHTRDLGITVTRIMHCLEYGLHYSQVRGSIGAVVRLVPQGGPELGRERLPY